MRAFAVTAALTLFAGAAASEEPAAPWRTVWLNAPGAIEKLKATNPAHYRKIMSLAGVTEGGPHGLIEVSSPAFRRPASGMLLTTYPPQRNFEITLDNTTYKGRATMDLGFRAMTLECPSPCGARR